MNNPDREQQKRVNDYFQSTLAYWDEIYREGGVYQTIYQRRRTVALSLVDKLALPAGTCRRGGVAHTISRRPPPRPLLWGRKPRAAGGTPGGGGRTRAGPARGARGGAHILPPAGVIPPAARAYLPEKGRRCSAAGKWSGTLRLRGKSHPSRLTLTGNNR